MIIPAQFPGVDEIAEKLEDDLPLSNDELRDKIMEISLQFMDDFCEPINEPHDDMTAAIVTAMMFTAPDPPPLSLWQRFKNWIVTWAFK